MSYSADVNEHILYPIPLNGSSVHLSGNARFNSSCGGTMYLPTLDDNITFTLTVLCPLVLSGAVTGVTICDREAGEPLNCSDVRRQWMGIGLDRVLKYGQRNATTKPDYRNLQDVGSGVFVSKIKTGAYYNIVQQRSNRISLQWFHKFVRIVPPKSHRRSSRGVIGVLILVVAAVYGCWKRRFSRTSNRQSDGAVGEKAPPTASTQASEPSPTSVSPASLALDTPTAEKVTPTASPVTASLPTLPAIPLSEAIASSSMTAERVALVQTLTRQGLSTTQIAAVLESMSNTAEPSTSVRRQLGGSDKTGQADDPPPVYDFKDRSL